MSKRSRPVRSRAVQLAVLAPVVLVGSLAIGLLARNSLLFQDLFGDSAAPQVAVAEADAREAALAKVAELKPELRGLVVERATRQMVSSVTDDEGLLQAVFDPPVDGFVYELTGPGSGQYQVVSGIVVVNAATGEVEAADFMEYNPPRDRPAVDDRD
jgi:hypothetical protein